MNKVYALGCFGDIRARHVRFLEESARAGPLTIVLRDDKSTARLLGSPPRFGFEERRYFLSSLRFVEEVIPAGGDLGPDELPSGLEDGAVWAVMDGILDLSHPAELWNVQKRRHAETRGLKVLRISASGIAGFPYEPPQAAAEANAPRVIATGSFDWLHTGHIRFFEEAAAWGELTVVVGHDANIRLLKGEGHPLIPEAERRYLVAAMRSVARAWVSSGSGWLDAEPEIARLRPTRYVVNADGDKPEKRSFCERNGIEYIVLERNPRPGLPRRSSTELRGF